MLPKVAAITMAYNEAGLLPVWARHYARQVGSDHCYVVDHGSTDTIILPPGMNTLRLPRSPHDDERRAGFISTFAEGLLRYYDWVIYTDVDELVLPDPSRFADLPNFCASLDQVDTVTTAGFDIQHVPDLEPLLDLTRPIGEQRGWARFTSAMCKPVLTRRPLSWSPGFHCSEQPLAFAGLYLFHLHWADLTLGLQRLEKTRHMPWVNDEFGAHQRISKAGWIELFQGMAHSAAASIPHDRRRHGTFDRVARENDRKLRDKVWPDLQHRSRHQRSGALGYTAPLPKPSLSG